MVHFPLETRSEVMIRAGWLLELASNFRPQYFWLLLGVASVFLAARKGIAALGTVLVAFALVVPIVPYYIPRTTSDKGSQYRALLLNVHQQNRRFEDVISLISSEQADLVALVEVDSLWEARLRSIEGLYPFSRVVPRSDNYGLALYSRYPIEETEIETFGRGGRPSIVATVRLEDQTIQVVVTHAEPPKSPHGMSGRDLHLEHLSEFVTVSQGPTMVLGDLNTTPWSAQYATLVEQSPLLDSRRGFGLAATWPAQYPLFRIPIDHILVTEPFLMSRLKVGGAVGSDHLPLIAEFRIEG